ncbi:MULTISPECIES: hypothetical protein [Phytobacter]|uniref:Uncharacterized protein n=1 Tax=Phytobacter diazotrophicus TaxID=395631 RepID=A0ABM7VUS8_9ENTR|nr:MULTISPECIES: hypothetical protein [Phytobacter]MCL5501818.1 hypothetical protein [Escherichia coli]BBE77559.1 hypothetical protein MRY16398_26150 [Phytobacter sp. MRY16-398]BDD50930.1 hypothetical protein PDTA9734_24170 [Phytobacter diazotrophicus]BEG81960.1 hypothetical protein PDTA9730_24160 [Phytobacter diazotrophicus]BEG87762.1 hypothetical protein PDTA9759_24180 [Phytobacter diazotrophicus]
MSNGNFPTFPVPARPGCGLGDKGMTYRQHLIAQLAPIVMDAFFNQDFWENYNEMAGSLMNAVDAIVAAEQETSK